MPPVTTPIPILLSVKQLADAVRADLSHDDRQIIEAEKVIYLPAGKVRQAPTPPRIIFELGEQFDIQPVGPTIPQAGMPGHNYEYPALVNGNTLTRKARPLMHTVDRAIVTIHHPGPKKLDSADNRDTARDEVVKLRAAVLGAIYRATHGSFAFFGGRWLEAEEDYRTGAACEFVVGMGCPVLDDPKLEIYNFAIKANMIARFDDRTYLVAEATAE